MIVVSFKIVRTFLLVYRVCVLYLLFTKSSTKMFNWGNAKNCLLEMSRTERRTLYKCGKNFKTLDDILPWCAYVRTDEARAKFALCTTNEISCNIREKYNFYFTDYEEKMKRKEENSDRKNEVPQTNEIKSDSQVINENDGSSEKTATETGNVKYSTDKDAKNERKISDEDAAGTSGSQVISQNNGSNENTDIETANVKDSTDTDAKHERKISDEDAAGTSGSQDISQSDRTNENTDAETGNVEVSTDNDAATTINDVDAASDSSAVVYVNEGEDEDSYSSDEDFYSFEEDDEARAAAYEAELRDLKYDAFNDKVSLFIGDINCLEIDAMVYCASEDVFKGKRVDDEVHSAAGSIFLRAECSAVGECKVGDVKITGGYKLPAKYLIHVVGPIGEHPELLESCYEKALDLLKENMLATIAFPCISTDINGYTNENAARIAFQTVRNWLWLEDEYTPEIIKRVIFCVSHEVDIDIYHKVMPKYFPFDEKLLNKQLDVTES